VIGSFALPCVKAALNLEDEDIPAPSILEGLLGIPKALFGLLHDVQNPDVVAPGQFCNSLLQNWLLRPCRRESLHIAEVTSREPLHIRELRAEVLREPVNDTSPPAVF